MSISDFLSKDEGEGKADLVLQCEDGDIRGIRGSVVSLASPVLAGALECDALVTGMHQIKVGYHLNQVGWPSDPVCLRLMDAVTLGSPSLLASTLCMQETSRLTTHQISFLWHTSMTLIAC